MSLFSSTAEYALRAVIHLALHPGGACTVQEIAGTTKVPAGYLSKVMQDLARAGILQSQRGPNGGLSLSRDPERLTILEVINAVDPIERIERCPLNIPSHGVRLCRLHQRLDDAIALVERALRDSTISDMLEPTKAGTHCLFPVAPGGSMRPAAVRISAKSRREAK